MLFKINDKLTVQFRFMYVVSDGIKHTFVFMNDSTGKEIASEMARCSREDNFSKVIGRKVALEHLFYKLKLSSNMYGKVFGDKNVRKRFWNEYFQWTNYDKVIGKGE